MIDINLTPGSSKKVKKKFPFPLVNIPQEALVGLVGGLFVLLFGVAVFLQVIIFVRVGQHKAHTVEWERLLPEKEKADQVLQELRQLRTKIKNIEKITMDSRIFWAPKLNAISDSVPRGVWLSKISFQDDILLIEGSAVSKIKNEMISVGSFTSNLKKQNLFVKDFIDIEVDSIQRRKIRDVEVADFIITAKIK